MKILREDDLNKSRDEIVLSSYKVCQNARFPVDYPDVYNHLYGSDGLVSSFLINDNNEIVGFGVVQNYNLEINLILSLKKSTIYVAFPLQQTACLLKDPIIA